MIKKDKVIENAPIVQLIFELAQNKPNRRLVHKLCDDTGVIYKEDLLDLMTDVLIFSGHINTKSKLQSKISKNKESEI